nr:unnamed protein product [Digitaria exilis]
MYNAQRRPAAAAPPSRRAAQPPRRRSTQPLPLHPAAVAPPRAAAPPSRRRKTLTRSPLHVVLPPEVAKLLPKNRLLSENEWRGKATLTNFIMEDAWEDEA